MPEEIVQEPRIEKFPASKKLPAAKTETSKPGNLQDNATEARKTERRISEAREILDEIQHPEKTKERNSSWDNSEIVTALKSRHDEGLPLRLAMLDIDSTMSGNPEAAQIVREELKKQGFVVIFITSRTEEMVMSKAGYEKSRQMGFLRPKPKLSKGTDGRMETKFADELPEFAGLYDSDIISGSTGNTMLLKQKGGGYKKDEVFAEQMREDSQSWREKTTRLLSTMDPEGKLFTLMPVDTQGNFEQGTVDVFPPDFRIQLNINNGNPVTENSTTGVTDYTIPTTQESQEEGLENKLKILEEFKKLRFDPSVPEEVRHELTNIRVTDDSNPEKGRYSLYLTPNRGWKANAAEYITTQITNELSDLGIQKSDLHLLIAGDSLPDVGMGLEGGLGTDAVFLIAGGSRLTDLFSERTRDFAGRDLSMLQKRLHEVQGEEGKYTFKTPLVKNERSVIVGDLAFPGTSGPDTILAYLNQKYSKKPG